MPRHRRGWAMRGAHAGGERSSHSPLTVAMLEPALLILLKEQPRHGYTLLSDLGAWGMDSIHPSVVYRTLRELEGLGWIASDWDQAQTKGPPRRNYRITEGGEAALGHWKAELGRTRELIDQLLNRIEPDERS